MDDLQCGSCDYVAEDVDDLLYHVAWEHETDANARAETILNHLDI